jgi:excisionase family DNA binding protein
MCSDTDGKPAVYVPTIRPLNVDYPTAAKLLGLGKRTLEQMVADGKLPVLRQGTRVLFPVAGLELWVEENSRYESRFVSETLYERKRRKEAGERKGEGRPRLLAASGGE